MRNDDEGESLNYEQQNAPYIQVGGNTIKGHTNYEYTMVRHYFLFFCFALGANIAFAQVRTGFKIGLNFSSIKGPSEVDDAGKTLEQYDNVTGFNIGASFNFPITDAFGLRSELLYSRKGGRYTYEGTTYRFFDQVLTTGTGKYQININNAFLDVPLMAYGRWKDFEVSGGVYGALLIQSTGEGALQYTGRTLPPLQNSVGNVEVVFNHNYLRDKVGETKGSDKIVVRVDGRTLELPKTVGAYYDFTEDKGKFYNRIDYGVVGGVRYYLSRALYAGVHLQYGLADLTNNKVDYSKVKVGTGNARTLQTDTDRNFTWQTSVGFNF